MRSTGSDKYKHRQLTMWDYLPRDTAEREEITEVCESPRITERDITNRAKQTEGLLEQILTDGNFERAYRQVKKNKGAGGIDGMQVDELLPYLRENQKKLVQTLRDGKYHPRPVRRVEIPKENVRPPQTVLQYGQPEQTHPDIIRNDKGRTSYIADT
jgi:hypothetical protein